MKNVILACALSLSHPIAWKPPLVKGPQTIKVVIPIRLLPDPEQINHDESWQPPLTDADLILHKFASLLTQSRNMSDVLIIKKPWWSWSDVTTQLRQLNPGGMVFIQGPKIKFHDWFMIRGWQHFPFMWRDFHIYKKPLSGNLFLVKSA
jgi:hypothetical protein